MRKRVWMVIVCVAAIIGIAAAVIYFACIKPEDPTPDVGSEEACKTKLEEFYEVIASPESAENLYDGMNGVREAALAFGDEALDKSGYVFDDVNEDGKEEVFIGCFDNENSEWVANEIYAAFTYDGDSLTPLFEKQKRNTFALTDTGTFYFYGSDAVKYHVLAEYVLTEEEGIVCKDFYFTYPKKGDGNSIGYYHNTTGQWDPAYAEEIPMTPEEFEALRKELAERTVPLEDVKFSEVGKE